LISSLYSIQQLLSALKALPVSDRLNCILSPGSRNAPITTSLWYDEAFHCTVIKDERSAGFIALGSALATGEPSLLRCTSGTAALNYAPAIAEAYYQKIPLIIVTADRPVHRIDQGEGQSIRQHLMYSNYVQSSYQLVSSDPLQNQSNQNQEILEQVCMDLVNYRRPVHLNVPLDEPLYDFQEKAERMTAISLSKIKPVPNPVLFKSLKRDLKESKKIAVFIGQRPGAKLSNLQISAWADNGVLFLHESLGNFYEVKAYHKTSISLSFLSEEDKISLYPDILITTGGAIISKALRKWIKAYGPAHHYHVDEDYFDPDTFEMNVMHVQMPFGALLEQVQPAPGPEYVAFYQRVSQKNVEAFNYKLEKEPFCDLRVFEFLARQSRADDHYHLANSTPVRYFDLFDFKYVRVQSNRGVGGIDGCTSTALGYSQCSSGKQIVITGDMAFFYDSNAFWNELRKKNILIILINNGGGNIFRIIQGPDKTNAVATLFESAYYRTAAHWCADHQVHYQRVQDIGQLRGQYKNVITKNGPCLLEIFTDASVNEAVYKRIMYNSDS